ncbi:MAG: hypothetical protein ACFCD0_17740 [Gemmataceae bacterium]
MLKFATKFAPVETAFQRAQEAGFRFAEFWVDDELLANWETIPSVAERFPFEYVIHFPNHVKDPDNTPKHAAELYRALGCRCMIIHPPMYKLYGPRLLDLNADMKLGIENLRLNTDQFEVWATTSDYLTLDVEHLWKMTLNDAPLSTLMETLERFWTNHGRKVQHIHMPGYLPGHPVHRPMYCSRDLVLPVMSFLAEKQFQGLVVSEADITYQNNYELRMDVLLFEMWKQSRENNPEDRPVELS